MPQKVSDVEWGDPGDSGWHPIHLKQLKLLIDYISDVEIDEKHIFEFEYCLNKLIEYWRDCEDLDDVWFKRELSDNGTTVQYSIHSALKSKSIIYIYLTPKNPSLLSYFKATDLSLATLFKFSEEDNG